MQYLWKTIGVLTVTLLTYVAADIMGFFSSKKGFEVENKVCMLGMDIERDEFDHRKTIVITGGSQGMGRALAKQLAAKGANIVIVARNKARLEEALAQIMTAARDPDTQRFLTISADVTVAAENARILDTVTAWNNGQPPDVVWANAGASVPALFIDTSLDTLRAQMDINYWAAAYLAQETLKRFFKPDASARSNAPRHFIMTSSTIAYVGLAGYATYAPAKSALRSLADSLRSEVQLYNGARKRSDAATTAPPRPVKVHIILPGTILTAGLEKENETKHPVTEILEDGDPRQTEDEVAAAAIKGLERGQFMITTQFLGNAMRGSMWGGSPRNNLLVDTIFSWLTSLAWLFIGPDMDAKVYNYGKNNGLAKAK